jgi:5-methylthioadenosine/S-adenosylhomocysteine deaminase
VPGVGIRDVLVVGNRIKNVGTGLRYPGAEVKECRGRKIVWAPFVNTHKHGWQKALSNASNAKLFGSFYIPQVTIRGLGFMTPDELAHCEYVSILNELDNGTGTVYVWCHAIRTLADAMTILQAVATTGARIVFVVGYDSTKFPFGGPDFGLAETMFAECQRLGIRYAMGVAGPQFTPPEEFGKQVAFADQHSVMLTYHDVPFVPPGQPLSLSGIPAARAAGLLRSTHMVVHGTGLLPADLGSIRILSVCPETDERAFNAADYVHIVDAARAGTLELSISNDAPAYGDPTMLHQARALATGHHRAMTPLVLGGQRPPAALMTDLEVLHTMTGAGQEALGTPPAKAGQRFGALKEEYEADVMIVRPRGTAVNAQTAAGALLNLQPGDIEWMMVGGREVNRRALSADLERAIPKLERIANRLLPLIG